MFRSLDRFHELLPTSAPATLDALDPRLKIYCDDRIAVWYAPVPPPAPRPSLWILGITPGWQQMRLAYAAAAEALRRGATHRQAALCPKPAMAFAGSMRRNLVVMLDELGLHDLFGVPSVGELFGTPGLRTGSVLKYPVFRLGRNYTGHTPGPMRHPVLKEMLDVVLCAELRHPGRELIIPLGKAVESVLAYAVDRGYVDRERILRGFPHPSGANGHRFRQFSAQKRRLRRELQAWYSGGAAGDRSPWN